MPRWDSKPGLNELLIVLWNSGLSGSQCAKEIGGAITRNAIVARIGRLRKSGLELRAVQVRIKRALPPPRLPKPKVVKADPPADPRTLEPLELDGEPITAWNAEKWHCRYSWGEIAAGNFRYCGRQVVAKSSFCPDHGALCHAPKHTATQAIEAA